MLVAAGLVVALAAVGVGLGFVLSGGGSSSAKVPARGSLAGALPGARDVQRLLAGIPQRGNVLGSASAPVTMVEYVDLQCPYCRDFEMGALPALVSRYVRAGSLKIEARLIAFIGPDSQRGRAAVIAAGQQNRLFNLMQLLYLNQGSENSGWLDERIVASAAASIPGLDVPRLLSERSSGTVVARARRFETQAAGDNVKGTPTILVGKSGAALKQVILTSPGDVRPIAAAVAASLR